MSNHHRQLRLIPQATSRIVPALQNFEALLARRTFIVLRTNPILRMGSPAEFRPPQAILVIPWRALDHSALTKRDEKGLDAHIRIVGDHLKI